MTRGGDKQGLGLAEQLLADFPAHVLRARHARDDDRDGRGQQQRRNLRDQAVADGQQRVGACGVAKRQVMHHDADGKAADDVEDQDHDAGGGVAAHELAGAVHGAVEVRFGAHFVAARARLVLGDESGVQVGVDGHLLAGHGVQGESRGHLRDAARALGHHDEVDDRQDDEHHDADGVVAADDELAEGLDDLAGGRRARVSVQQHDARGGDVQRQAQQGGEQQHAREHAEVQRPGDVEHRHHHHQRQGDVEREQHVKRQGRQRQDHHRQHGEHAHRHADAALERIDENRLCGLLPCDYSATSMVGADGGDVWSRRAARSWKM